MIKFHKTIFTNLKYDEQSALTEHLTYINVDVKIKHHKNNANKTKCIV